MYLKRSIQLILVCPQQRRALARTRRPGEASWRLLECNAAHAEMSAAWKRLEPVRVAALSGMAGPVLADAREQSLPSPESTR